MEQKEPSLADLPREAFKDFVLYILPGESNSERANDLVHDMDNVHVQDVRDLDSWPVWLVGVPTLVHNTEQNAYRGTACLQLLHKERAAPTGSGGPAGFSWGDDDKASEVSPIKAPVRDTPAGRLTSSDVTDYINARNSCGNRV